MTFIDEIIRTHCSDFVRYYMECIPNSDEHVFGIPDFMTMIKGDMKKFKEFVKDKTICKMNYGGKEISLSISCNYKANPITTPEEFSDYNTQPRAYVFIEIECNLLNDTIIKEIKKFMYENVDHHTRKIVGKGLYKISAKDDMNGYVKYCMLTDFKAYSVGLFNMQSDINTTTYNKDSEHRCKLNFEFGCKIKPHNIPKTIKYVMDENKNIDRINMRHISNISDMLSLVFPASSEFVDSLKMVCKSDNVEIVNLDHTKIVCSHTNNLFSIVIRIEKHSDCCCWKNPFLFKNIGRYGVYPHNLDILRFQPIKEHGIRYFGTDSYFENDGITVKIIYDMNLPIIEKNSSKVDTLNPFFVFASLKNMCIKQSKMMMQNIKYEPFYNNTVVYFHENIGVYNVNIAVKLNMLQVTFVSQDKTKMKELNKMLKNEFLTIGEIGREIIAYNAENNEFQDINSTITVAQYELAKYFCIGFDRHWNIREKEINTKIRYKFMDDVGILYEIDVPDLINL